MLRSAGLPIIKLWKHLLLVAGLIGFIGIFTPLVETRTTTPLGPVAIELTAYQLTFGLERTHELLGKELPVIVEKRLSTVIRDARDDARLVAEASRGAILLFIPALVLLALGLYGLIKQRCGRVVGALGLLFAAASIAAFFGLRWGIDYGMKEAGFKRTTLRDDNGATMLLVAGIVGAVGSLGALIRPQAPIARQRRAFAPPMPPPPGPAPGAS